ncbi:rhodanese-like domain-containing protein [Ammoniphilus sp. 3BR4]|uniref:rhodanese-like domain-containing protein n=1 Tax=Ammoniphilus sp. 3BR4 TaxID=3158265 RepID=UPI0034673B0B
MDQHYIHASDFVKKLEQGELDQSLIIDVREPYEWEQYRLEQATLIPMNTIPSKWTELPADRDIYLVCAHGVRSWHVMSFLLQNGLQRAINVEGGMAEIYPLLSGGE